PDALERIDATGLRARQAPLDAGGALVWNANVLHWGGPSTDRARHPRTSITFTFRRSDVAADVPPALHGRPDLDARLDLVADQVEVYAHLDRTVTPELREWAAIRRGFSRGRGR